MTRTIVRIVSAACVALFLAALPARAHFPSYATREGLVGFTTSTGHKIVERDWFVALPSKTERPRRG